MLGRFFGRLTGGNWRPPADELRFALAAGFDGLQVRSDRPGELEDELGIPPAELGALFAESGLEPILELLVAHDGGPRTVTTAVRTQLPAIREAGFRRVHVHPVGQAPAEVLADDFTAALELAAGAGLRLGVEHNASGHRLLTQPEQLEALLDAVPGLAFVWDLNHTPTADVPRYLALRERFSLVHVSDTPLPAVNHHLPLGRGSVDLSALAGLDVPFVLVVGGLPHSGGPGLDTDEALRDSLARLRSALG
jgi:sugar phosphate isomerase/epimerase